MPEKNRKQIEAIKRQIDRIDLICTGTLLERTKVCGKPNCRCATDTSARHGPYHEWNRREAGRLRHRIVSLDEAKSIGLAMNDYQILLDYLQQWEDESIRIILKR